MADPESGRVDYFICDPRAIFDVPTWKPPARLARTARASMFRVTRDEAFDAVIDRCSIDRSTANRCWIGEKIKAAFKGLHELGLAHSVEAWEGERLAGGLYGLALGGIFFGESMFTVREPWARDASKIAFVHLMRHLRSRGFTVVDSQYANPHVMALGAVETPLSDYRVRLDAALTMPVQFA